MRHRNHSLRLSQKPHHAWMLQRNLVTSLLLYERVRTTKKRALVIRPVVDNLLTLGKTARTNLAIRRINEVVTDENACRKILEVFKQRYAGRNGGHVRMKPVGMRRGDGALLVDLTLVNGTDSVTTPPDENQKKQKRQKTSASRTPKKSSISSASSASSR